jgi:serine protease Do
VVGPTGRPLPPGAARALESRKASKREEANLPLRVGEIMTKAALEIGRMRGALLLAAALIVGVVCGVSLATWGSLSVVGAQKATRAARADSRPIPASASDMGYAAILKQALSAVVNISSSKIVKTPGGAPFGPFFNDPFFQQFFGNRFFHGFQMPQEQRERSLGSGVIVRPDGYILTNNHVIEGATEIKVFLPDKRQLKGKVVGSDPKTDVAVVKIEANDLPTLTMGDSSKIQVGDLAFAIGDPFGIGETATMGIVSATGRNGLDLEDYEDFIQTDAAINPGNSGGALVNARGELIGINTAIITGGGGGNQGVGFAIPIDMARRIMDQIMKNGKVVRGYLGVIIQEVTPELAKAFKVPQGKGALVGDVTPGGPGDKAGLEKGDVIEQLNGQTVDSINELRLHIASMTPGTVAHLKILRNGEEKEVPITLGELPGKTGPGETSQTSESSPLRGVQVENLTPAVARGLGLEAGTRGVVITDVENGTPASDAGLQRDDVIEEINHHAVTNVREYETAVRETGKQEVVLLVNRSGQTSFVVVEPE